MSAFPFHSSTARDVNLDAIPSSSGRSESALNLNLRGSWTSAARVFNRVLGIPLLGLLWVYRQLISPALHFAGGPSCGCRYFPTCSNYAAEAIRVHGPLAGLFLSTKRLLRCTPLHPGGVDFVPLPTALRPRCVRASSTRRTAL